MHENTSWLFAGMAVAIMLIASGAWLVMNADSDATQGSQSAPSQYHPPNKSNLTFDSFAIYTNKSKNNVTVEFDQNEVKSQGMWFTFYTEEMYIIWRDVVLLTTYDVDSPSEYYFSYTFVLPQEPVRVGVSNSDRSLELLQTF